MSVDFPSDLNYSVAGSKMNHSEVGQEGSNEIVTITVRARDDRSSPGRLL